MDPEPPADHLTCRRCGHGYPQHAPRGGGCLVWSAEEGWHCRCPVFSYVDPDTPVGQIR